ncbi:hypothetical protein [Brevibacterium luteolum]|uniref:hypothetical protein n=1 Tax=Brevibacterium luteolum TaxID=199591 RepID=UPI00223BA7A0|nr:hypothetical protein [Brevibacterium luteolum]MCT1890649.1 hypothetical protein [Brevibacterium luteolum]MCT1923710.1 hypothetical protein [Brevibacterium luteolum]
MTETPVSPGTTPRGLSDSIAGVLAAAASGQRCAAAAARFGLNGTPAAIEYVGCEIIPRVRALEADLARARGVELQAGPQPAAAIAWGDATDSRPKSGAQGPEL